MQTRHGEVIQCYHMIFTSFLKNLCFLWFFEENSLQIFDCVQAAWSWARRPWPPSTVTGTTASCGKSVFNKFFNFNFQVKTKMSTTIMNLHAYEYRYISSQKIIQKYCFIPRFFVKSFNSNTTASALPLLRRKHLVFSRCGGSLVVPIFTTRGTFFNNKLMS